jgi:hypothetical protein
MRRSRGAALAAGAVEAVADDPGCVAGELGVVGVDADRGDADAVSHTVAALYVDPKGVYADAPGVELWGEARDARLYEGPWPVVAHPPCARWSRLAGFTEARFGYKRGEDGGCFAAALEAVRRFGGVLEHPAYSKAWDAFNLPKPLVIAGWTGGLCGGFSAYVEQGRYGLPVKKATWLYAYGVELLELRWGRVLDLNGERPNGPWGGTDTWRDRWGGRAAAWEEARGSVINSAGVRCRPSHLGQTSTTPPVFRDALLTMARSSPERFRVKPLPNPRLPRERGKVAGVNGLTTPGEEVRREE